MREMWWICKGSFPEEPKVFLMKKGYFSQSKAGNIKIEK
jgi:hypothetical protein